MSSETKRIFQVHPAWEVSHDVDMPALLCIPPVEGNPLRIQAEISKTDDAYWREWFTQEKEFVERMLEMRPEGE